MEEIKECPYCGSDQVETMETWGKRYVNCNDCNATGPTTTGSKNDAVLLWNAASNALSKKDAEIARLTEALSDTEEQRHETVSKLSLALIREAASNNRQDELEAEIEKLRKEHQDYINDVVNTNTNAWMKYTNNLKAEIARLVEACDDLEGEYMRMKEQRDEARKVARRYYNAANAWMKNWTELINALPAQNEPQSVRVTETSEIDGS